MKCRQVQFYLTDYLSGNLSLNETRDFEEHLQSCAICRITAQEERKLVTATRGLPVPDPGESYWSGLEQVIMERAKTGAAAAEYPATAQLRERRGFPWRLAVPLAASLALFFVSLDDSQFLQRLSGAEIPSIAANMEDNRGATAYGQPTRPGEFIEHDYQVEYTLLLSAPGLAPRNLLMIEIINQTASEGPL